MHRLVRFSAQGLTRLYQGVLRMCSHLEARLEKKLSPSLVMLLAEFTSLWLKDVCPRILAGFWKGAAFSCYKSRAVLCHMILTLDPLTTWQLAFSRPNKGELDALARQVLDIYIITLTFATFH